MSLFKIFSSIYNVLSKLYYILKSVISMAGVANIFIFILPKILTTLKHIYSINQQILVSINIKIFFVRNIIIFSIIDIYSSTISIWFLL